MSEAITNWSDAYDNVGHIHNAKELMEIWPKLSESYREQSNVETNIPYADGERNHFDVFHPEGAVKGLFIFVHGGYWLRFDKSFWSHFAQGSLAKGYAVAMPSYTLCPNAKISQITNEVTQSIEGVHDLRPILNIIQNETIQLNQVEALAESPALLKPHLGIPVDCIVGENERPEFIRQNDLLANIWRGMGVATSSHHIDGKHHFDVIDDLMNPEGLICSLL